MSLELLSDSLAFLFSHIRGLFRLKQVSFLATKELRRFLDSYRNRIIDALDFYVKMIV